MFIQPAVSRLETEWQVGHILQLNVGYEEIRSFGDSLQVTQTPTFILFDGQGREIQRWVGEAPTTDELPSPIS
jgi:thioredoxin-related protein